MRALLLARCLEHEHAVPHHLLHPHGPAATTTRSKSSSSSRSRGSTAVVIDITGDSSDEDEGEEGREREGGAQRPTTDPSSGTAPSPPANHNDTPAAAAASVEPLFRLHPRRAFFYQRLLRLVSLGACPSDPPALLGPQVRARCVCMVHAHRLRKRAWVSQR